MKTGYLVGHKRENPETIITRQVRDALNLMRIPHVKHWGGPMSAKGIPDIIGALPGWTVQPGDQRSLEHPPGRGFFCEIKVPGHHLRPEQAEFLDRMRQAGAVAICVHGVEELLTELVAADFGPATRIKPI